MKKLENKLRMINSFFLLSMENFQLDIDEDNFFTYTQKKLSSHPSTYILYSKISYFFFIIIEPN